MKSKIVKSSIQPLIIYDGICILCNGFVQWIIKKDTSGKIKFTTLQSDLGKKIVSENEVNGDTVVLIFENEVYTKSDVALVSARLVGGIWKGLYLLKWIPKGLRDWVYDIVAGNRYKWFGKHDACLLPDPKIKERFI